jgi:hypothetical protein
VYFVVVVVVVLLLLFHHHVIIIGVKVWVFRSVRATEKVENSTVH